jgi:hypothetical protein
MTPEIFNESILRMSANGHRIPVNEAEILYKILSYIPDAEFKKITDLYIMEERHPRNVEGYFKRQFSAMKTSAEQVEEKKFESGAIGSGEITPEQHCLFFECVMLAYKVRKKDYSDWCFTFNNAWAMKGNGSLTEYLKAEKDNLLAGVPF